MLNFGICASIVSALLAGNIPASTAPVVWSDDCIRVSHAAEIVSSDRGLMYIQTEDGNIWGGCMLSYLTLTARITSRMTAFYSLSLWTDGRDLQCLTGLIWLTDSL